jgi:hypothetical protein
MMRQFRSLAGRSLGHPNLQALAVVATTTAAVYLNTAPLPAGSEPLALAETELAFASTALIPKIVCPPIPASMPGPLADGVEPPVAASEAAPTAIATPAMLTGKWAMQLNVTLLKKGLAEFARVPDYTATLTKRERIGGDLTEEQQISLKIRQAPFSVYMKWRSGETGQQVIFVDGQNEGNLLVKPGGLKGRLVRGCLTIDPTSSLAMAQARYPVTMVGLPTLAEQILKYQVAQLEKGSGYTCEMRDDVEFDGRPCYQTLVTYASPEENPDYRKSEILIDKQLSMPVFVRNYTWARDADPATIDEETLVEHYTYTEIQLSQQLADQDFDRNNGAYRMVR